MNLHTDWSVPCCVHVPAVVYVACSTLLGTHTDFKTFTVHALMRMEDALIAKNIPMSFLLSVQPGQFL